MTTDEREQLAQVLPMIGTARFAVKHDKGAKADKLLSDAAVVIQKLLGIRGD